MKGYTLIEFLILLAFIAIFGMAIFGAITGQNRGNTLSWGVNGAVEMRCINGLEFTVGSKGDVRQVYDQFGHGVPCK